MDHDDQDDMLRLLNEQMQRQFGQSLPSTGITQSDTTHDVNLTDESEKQDDTISSFFPLFYTANHPPKDPSGNEENATEELPRIRLLSPSDLSLQEGRSLNRVLAVEDEDRALVNERRRQIHDVAVDAAWLLETSQSSHWAKSSQPPRKLRTISLLRPSSHRMPLPVVAIAYTPSPSSSSSSHKSSTKIQANVEEFGKVKLKAYPDLSKERLVEKSNKIALRRARILANNKKGRTTGRIITSAAPIVAEADASEHEVKQVAVRNMRKRSSKKRRMHEKAGTAT